MSARCCHSVNSIARLLRARLLIHSPESMLARLCSGSEQLLRLQRVVRCRFLHKFDASICEQVSVVRTHLTGLAWNLRQQATGTYRHRVQFLLYPSRICPPDAIRYDIILRIRPASHESFRKMCWQEAYNRCLFVQKAAL